VERDELNGILILVDAGAFLGVIVALMSRGTRHPFKWTAVGSGLGAPTAMLLSVGAGGAAESIRRFGFDPISAILAAISSCFFAVFALPIICGLPALLTGVAAQTQLQRMRRKNVRLRFGLKTLLLIAAIVPPSVGFLYSEPAMGVITVSALIGAFVAVNIAMAIVELG